MKLRNLIRLCFVMAAVLIFAGCGRDEAEEGAADVLTRTVQFSIPNEEMAVYNTFMLGEALYYCEALRPGGKLEGQTVFLKDGDGEPAALAGFSYPRQWLIYFLADWEGSIYCLYYEIEEREGAADYRIYLQKDDAEGKTEYRTLAAQETVVLEEGVSAGEVFPESLLKWNAIKDGTADAQGFVCLYSGYNLLFCFDASGKFLCETESRTEGQTGGFKGLINGGGYGCYFYDIGEEKALVRRIDMQAGTLTKEEELPFKPEEILSILSGYDDGILVVTSQSLYLCRPSGSEGSVSGEGCTAEPLLNWKDFGLSGDRVRQVCIDEEGYLVLTSGTSNLKQVRIGDVKEDGASGKQTVILGVSTWTKEMVAEAIEDFNDSSPYYQIETVEYDTEGAAFNDLYKKLLKGEGADLFSLYDLSLPVDVLADRGVLEDLMPYFEQSGLVDLDDVLPRIVDIGTYQNKLVNIIPVFSMEGLLVREGYTVNHGWTQEQFLAYGQAYPDIPMVKIKGNYFLMYLYLMADMEGYIDWDNKTCRFDTDRFIQLLKSVSEANVLGFKETDGLSSAYESFIAGGYLVMDYNIVCPEDYTDAMDCLEGYELAGYPSVSGRPYFLLYPQISSYGINSRSQCKEGAWAFIEYLMSEKFQSRYTNMTSPFPARKAAFEERLENDMLTASKGNLGSRLHSFTGEVISGEESPEVTEEAREFLRFMADNMYLDNSAVRGAEYKAIISEEIAACLEGEKTAEEAAELIQNRVSIFMAE